LDRGGADVSEPFKIVAYEPGAANEARELLGNVSTFDDSYDTISAFLAGGDR
jgi:hypothetical protein